MDLTAMAAEVEQVNREKGWYDDDKTFGEMIALLHSEASEALEAYRHWGFDDMTPDGIEIRDCKATLPKPEGVGSELADVLIRLLDDALRWNVDLENEVPKAPWFYGLKRRFGDQIADMHMFISRIMIAWEAGWNGSEVDQPCAALFVYLTQVAADSGIDLEAEYRRKLAYNKTRPYRHGNKRL